MNELTLLAIEVDPWFIVFLVVLLVIIVGFILFFAAIGLVVLTLFKVKAMAIWTLLTWIWVAVSNRKLSRREKLRLLSSKTRKLSIKY